MTLVPQGLSFHEPFHKSTKVNEMKISKCKKFVWLHIADKSENFKNVVSAYREGILKRNMFCVSKSIDVAELNLSVQCLKLFVEHDNSYSMSLHTVM